MQCSSEDAVLVVQATKAKPNPMWRIIEDALLYAGAYVRTV